MTPIDSLKYILHHPLSSRQPFEGVYRYLSWQARSRLQSEIVFDWISGAKLVVRRGMTGATGNIYCGLHEFVDMAFLLHFLGPSDLLVDVGANIGSYTILASAVCGAQVVAIEPDPDTMASLRRNIVVNGKQDAVETVQAALGRSTGSVRFTIGRDTMNRIATEDHDNLRSVALTTLDIVAKDRAPTLIKMDVEGFEGDVVAGGMNTFSSPSLLAVITEGGGIEVRKPLVNAGFVEFEYEPFSRRLTPVSAAKTNESHNVLFLRHPEVVQQRVAAAPRRHVIGVEF